MITSGNTVGTSGIAAAELSAAAPASATSWGAIIAGALAAAALSFILIILGLGLGLSSVSPYSYNDAPLGTAAIVWLAFTQLAAAGIGGYMAGRLRTRWAGVHTDEVYFRDTAHGLLAWAVATLLTVALLAGGVRAALSGAIDAGTAVAGATAAGATAAGKAASNGDAGQGVASYYGDMLLRGDGTAAAGDDGTRAEVNRIVTAALQGNALPPDDRQYLATIVAKRTGIAQQDAERRVDDVYNRTTKAVADAKAKAKAAAEEARKAAAHSALWMFVALLLGAFVASLAATFGGRLRDRIN
ncbi:hypothetical protein IP91_03165 [Pseudoduganella lurida]|uniref:Transmembrane protein n=1 Tax=Pseudoduganella lurida TaxID=1036180 RepID=A0A562R5Q2_9BURK|nr:hypothetical protein [Pseudoduganella lurida]TWI64395.1 hypothetical protein IP91_03165 [Pseudoduganella lurida]